MAEWECNYLASFWERVSRPDISASTAGSRKRMIVTDASAPMHRLFRMLAIIGSVITNDITIGTSIRISPDVSTEWEEPSNAV